MANNDMKLVDVNCGRLIPQGNLNPNQAGSYANMRAELDRKQNSSKGFQATTSYGFQPGYTTKGLNNVAWGHATF
jgi:hypothetical protein